MGSTSVADFALLAGLQIKGTMCPRVGVSLCCGLSAKQLVLQSERDSLALCLSLYHKGAEGRVPSGGGGRPVSYFCRGDFCRAHECMPVGLRRFQGQRAQHMHAAVPCAHWRPARVAQTAAMRDASPQWWYLFFPGFCVRFIKRQRATGQGSAGCRTTAPAGVAAPSCLPCLPVVSNGCLLCFCFLCLLLCG